MTVEIAEGPALPQEHAGRQEAKADIRRAESIGMV
jgi:hypothetical protein